MTFVDHSTTCPHCGGELAQAPDRSRQIAPRLTDRQRIAASPNTGPWMSSLDGARYVRVPSREAFVLWARRRGLTPIKDGRLLKYARADVDRVLLAKATDARRFKLLQGRGR